MTSNSPLLSTHATEDPYLKQQLCEVNWPVRGRNTHFTTKFDSIPLLLAQLLTSKVILPGPSTGTSGGTGPKGWQLDNGR